MSEQSKATFMPADMKVLWYLAIALGVTLCGECFIAKNMATVVLAVFLNVATMVICPLVIYILRRAKAKKPNKAVQPTTTSVMPRANEGRIE